MSVTDGAAQDAGTRVVLLVGTQKGLFRLEAAPGRGAWSVEGPLIKGYEILHAWLDPRDRRVGYAAVDHPVWGAHIHRSADAGRSWTPLAPVPSHSPGEYPERLKAIWYLAPGLAENPRTLFAGIDPPGLFRSDDEGASWEPLDGLNRHPTRATWQPSRGGFSIHCIHADPHVPRRLYAAVSAGGAFRSDDAGASWVPINRGVRAENLPQQDAPTGHNIHHLVAHPGRPGRLYRQCYNGTYRSDDAGETWVEITAGLPSDYGHALCCDPNDPDTVYVLPEESNHMRTTIGGRLCVYRTRDAGASWEALGCGLPQAHAYVTVLREALATDDCQPCGVYFGSTGGHLFASPDAGDTWTLVAGYLPRILSVSASRVPGMEK